MTTISDLSKLPVLKDWSYTTPTTSGGLSDFGRTFPNSSDWSSSDSSTSDLTNSFKQFTIRYEIDDSLFAATKIDRQTLSRMLQSQANWQMQKYIEAEKLKRVEVDTGVDIDLALPDGHVIKVKSDGSFAIENKDAKVTYKACNMREFNRYVNASDLVEEFIRLLGRLGCKQSQVLNVPIELFINFLILKAAEADNVTPPPDVPKLENHPLLPSPRHDARCLFCKRFICRTFAYDGFNFCNGDHAQRYWERMDVKTKDKIQSPQLCR